MLTWQEYRANTDPRDASSKFEITRLVPSNPPVFGQITLRTAPNRKYQVETSSDLLNWEILKTDIHGTGDEITAIDGRLLSEDTSVFYRVLVY